MNKIILPLLIAVFSVYISSAQLGVKSGIGFSSLNGNSISSNSRTGYLVGVFGYIPFGDKLMIQSELLYASEGGENTVLRYINLPILVKFYPVENFNIQLGPQSNYLMSVKNGERSGLKRLSFSLGAGVGYDLSEHLHIDARYVLGLTDILKSNQGSLKQNTFRISLGVILN